MDLYQLHYFVTLVEQKTYTKAAEWLHISQPSLSMSIKKLEREVGLSLLDRTTRKSTLTIEGNVLYQEAKYLLNHFQYLQNEMARLKNDGPLELPIGLIESSKFWMPKVLKQFKKDHNDVRIKVQDVLSLKEVVHALSHFQIELAITNQFIDDDRIDMIPLYEEKLVILLPPHHPLIAKDELSMKELGAEPLIICKAGYQSRDDILNAFRNFGIKPNIQVEIEKFETACSMVEEGIGVTVVPENYIKMSHFFEEQIKGIEDASISRTVYLAYMKNRYFPPLVQKCMDLIVGFFQRNN